VRILHRTWSYARLKDTRRTRRIAWSRICRQEAPMLGTAERTRRGRRFGSRRSVDRENPSIHSARGINRRGPGANWAPPVEQHRDLCRPSRCSRLPLLDVVRAHTPRPDPWKREVPSLYKYVKLQKKRADSLGE